MKMSRLFSPLIVAFALSACGNWSTSDVDLASGGDTQGGNQAQAASTAAPTSPESILLMEGDLTDRPYETVADIEVTVNKSTIFDPDPTRAAVDQKLREEAAKLGADAVILVRYGTVGVSLLSWGSLDGQGRAVTFVN